MPDSEIKRGLKIWLSSNGFSVDEVPTGPTPSPDLLAKKDYRYLLEIKTRNENPHVSSARKRRLAQGDVVLESMPFTPQARISEIIRDGVAQLQAYPADDRDLCILWLITGGPDTTGQYEQLRATLFGLADVIGTDSPYRIPCYYLRHSAFHRHRDILDGAVLCEDEECKLLINSYSPRVSALAASDLGLLFGAAVEDPGEEERSGQAYIADCDLDRSDEIAVLEYVRQKYRRENLQVLNIGTTVSYMELPATS